MAARWLRLCPVRKTPDGEPAEPTDAELDTIRRVPARLAEVRRRLSDVSWLMRLIAEPIARRANREDQVTGRFWQGRFKTVKICDEAALLACAVYVDLNPIRAGLAMTPESSDFTSVQRRIAALVEPAGSATRPDAWLAPVPLCEAVVAPGPQPSASGARAIGVRASGARASDKGFLSLSVEDYLRLVDWTGRQIVHGRGGRIPAELPPILKRVGIDQHDWLPLVTGFGRLFHRVAGAPTRWRGCPGQPGAPAHADSVLATPNCWAGDERFFAPRPISRNYNAVPNNDTVRASNIAPEVRHNVPPQPRSLTLLP